MNRILRYLAQLNAITGVDITYSVTHDTTTTPATPYYEVNVYTPSGTDEYSLAFTMPVSDDKLFMQNFQTWFVYDFTRRYYSASDSEAVEGSET